jgi:signal recognition particle receptor subunit beta
MGQHKLIFTGPVGAGKTTAIASISDEPPVRTDEAATDMTKQRKRDTTVALDYGAMNLPGGEKLHLYGTPGQERFDFMWDILSTGGIGLMILINNNRPDPLKDLSFFLQRFETLIKSTAVAIGVTQTDLKEEPFLNDYHLALTKLNIRAPVFEVDARSKTDVSLLVQALLFSLDPGLNLEQEENNVEFKTA